MTRGQVFQSPSRAILSAGCRTSQPTKEKLLVRIAEPEAKLEGRRPAGLKFVVSDVTMVRNVLRELARRGALDDHD